MTADARVTVGFSRMGTKDKFVSTANLGPSHVFRVSGTALRRFGD